MQGRGYSRRFMFGVMSCSPFFVGVARVLVKSEGGNGVGGKLEI